MEIKYDFNDILIKPKITTNINSRTEINPYYGMYLPLITAPMDTVVSEKNINIFLNNKINVCAPRNCTNHYYTFKSFSLIDFKNWFLIGAVGRYDERPIKILIDIANGHTNDLIITIKKAKEKYKDKLILMVGNIANPETFKLLSEAGADYIRVGIGNGGGCLTTKNCGVGYPMASLIKECYEISCTLDKSAYIVADGGMQNYGDIIKALALGADYVMVGNIFNKAIESAGDNYLFKRIKISQKLAEKLYKLRIPIYKKFRGMSTKEVQKKWGNKIIKTSEGVVRYRKVEYTLQQWCENFEHYLRSAMSYSGALKLSKFIGHADIINISENSYNRFNK